ncbi:MEDS domain-containing protein [Noviherbaspirillum sp. ST9]|uniref:MEDS domain-containing protein n=1 Tax=Noviherbaspirillum sp. ST9 TaxID=3401606 RepID=UPI003B589E6B
MVDSILRGLEGGVTLGQHISHFYQDVEQMVHAACGYIMDGLHRGEAVLIVATQAHWAKMVGKLAAMRNIDLVDAVMSGQLRHIDANVVLAGLLENGMPDDSRFRERAGALVEGALGRFGKVRIVTELAGMLGESGNRAAALRLEDLWKGLATRLPFTLLCTYRADACRREYNSALDSVHNAHASMDGSRPESREANAPQEDDPRSAKP